VPQRRMHYLLSRHAFIIRFVTNTSYYRTYLGVECRGRKSLSIETSRRTALDVTGVPSRCPPVVGAVVATTLLRYERRTKCLLDPVGKRGKTGVDIFFHPAAAPRLDVVMTVRRTVREQTE
jgi:hypothetical protein